MFVFISAIKIATLYESKKIFYRRVPLRKKGELLSQKFIKKNSAVLYDFLCVPIAIGTLRLRDFVFCFLTIKLHPNFFRFLL